MKHFRKHQVRFCSVCNLWLDPCPHDGCPGCEMIEVLCDKCREENQIKVSQDSKENTHDHH
jgi:hypothetical protein